MAKLPKSQNPANWRKGKDLRVGNLIAVAWLDGQPVEFSPIASYDGTERYMSVTNHAFTLANGDRKLFAGGEFAEGLFS